MAADGVPDSAALGEFREFGLSPEGLRASTKAARGELLPSEPRGIEAEIDSFCDGEADNEGVLNGMKDTEGLRPVPLAPSAERRDDLDPCAERILGGTFLTAVSSGDSEPATRAFRRADIGLVPVAAPT